MPVLIVAAEVFLSAYVLLTCIRILRKPFLSNLGRLAFLALAFAVALCAGYFFAALLNRLTRNPFVLFTVESLLSLIIFSCIFTIGVRLFDRRMRWKRDEKSRLRRVVDVSGNVVLVMMVIACAVLAVDFLANLAGLSPLESTVRRHSLYSGYFLPPEDRGPGGVDSVDLNAGVDRQAKFIAGLQRTFRRSKNALAAKTGSAQALDELAALVEILNLPQSEMAWLVENEPELQRLKNNKLLNQALGDEEIIELVIKVGEGSIVSLYKLGEEPRIQALVFDPEIKRAISSIDLKDLRQQAGKRMKRRGGTFSLTWKTAGVDLPMQLESILDDPSRWSDEGNAAGFLAWGEGIRFGAGRAVVEAGETQKGILCIESGLHPFLWVNGIRAEPEKKNGRYEFPFVLEPGANEFLVMMDLRNSGRTRARAYVIKR